MLRKYGCKYKSIYVNIKVQYGIAQAVRVACILLYIDIYELIKPG